MYCKYCVKLYLTAGQGSKPIEFGVVELMRNGSNIGRKAKDWKPVIGATHPWCRCEIEHIPEGHVWDEKEKMYVRDRKNLTERQKKIRQLIKFS